MCIAWYPSSNKASDDKLLKYDTPGSSDLLRLKCLFYTAEQIFFCKILMRKIDNIFLAISCRHCSNNLNHIHKIRLVIRVCFFHQLFVVVVVVEESKKKLKLQGTFKNCMKRWIQLEKKT